MALDKIEAICTKWIIDVANDMKAEINRLVKHGGGQESDLEGSVSPSVTVLDNGNIVVALSMNRYWEVIEKGRGAGKKMPPSKPIEEWIIKKNIPVDKFLVTIRRNQTAKRRGLSLAKNRANRGLSYDKKVQRLSWMIARSIGKKGIKPRPFFDKVFNQSRIDELKNMLAPVMKEEFIIELKNGSNNT